MSIDLADGESMVKEGFANHFKGFESVGGRLLLTTRRLVFKPHKLNVQRQQDSYPLEEIATVEPRNTWWVVPNGLLVTMRDGHSEKFVVYGRRRWVAEINQAREQPAAH
jgi:hypothetical protein